MRGSGSLRRRIRLVGRVPGRLRKPKPLSVRFSLYETVIKRCISTVKQRVLKVTVSSTSECESGDARNPRPRISPAAPAFPHVYLGPPKRIPLATSLSCRCSLGMKEKDRRRGCRSRSSNGWLSLDGSGFSGNRLPKMDVECRYGCAENIDISGMRLGFLLSCKTSRRELLTPHGSRIASAVWLLVTAPCPCGSGAAPLSLSRTPANWKRTQGSPLSRPKRSWRPFQAIVAASGKAHHTTRRALARNESV